MVEDAAIKRMTKEGFEELQNELAFRKTEKTAEITAKIMEAKAQGDLSENSEYEEARAEQAANAQRIEEIESILKGNTCGPKPTSCADQLCIGLRQALDSSK